MSLQLRVNDAVMVLSGRSRGRTGKIIRLVKEAGRAYVEKVNMVKRHTRPTQKTPQGGIIEKEASIHISNLALVCTACKKPTRIRAKILKDGKKVRACCHCDEVLGKE